MCMCPDLIVELGARMESTRGESNDWLFRAAGVFQPVSDEPEQIIGTGLSERAGETGLHI